MLQKNIFRFQPFLVFFGQKKQPTKTAKNEENWQNSNRLMKFSEIWYVDASKQIKMLKKNIFRFQPFWPFLDKKNSQKKCKNWQKMKKIGKIQTV